MKKIILSIVFILLLVMPLLSAIEFEMQDSFGREGVLIAKISGQFVQPPLRENIVLYRGHVRTAIDAQISKIDDDYYLFAPLAGKEPRNYTLTIEDVAYMKGSIKVTEDLSKNFTIAEEYASFIIDPGFIVTKEPFLITLDNLEDEEVIIEMEITTLNGDEGGIKNYEEDVIHELSIKPGAEEFKFELDFLPGPTSKLMSFTYDNLTYEIPVSLYVDEQSQQSQTFAFDIQPQELELTMPTHDSLSRLIYIYNTGTGTLNDVQVKISDSLKPYVTLSEDRFSQILPNSNANLNMSVVSGATNSIGGKLEVTTEEGVYNDIRISIRFREGYEPSPEESGEEVTTDENCESSAIGGKICLNNQDCDGEEIYAKNGLCCIGVCKTRPSGAVWKWIGWSLLVVLILGGIWFYFKKYRGTKKPVDLLKFVRKK